MKRTLVHRMVAVALGLVLLSLVGLGSAGGAREKTTTPEMMPTPISNEQEHVQAAILKALVPQRWTLSASESLEILGANVQDKWAFAAVVRIDTLTGKPVAGESLYTLVHRVEDGDWVAVLPDSNLWDIWLQQAPDNILPLGFKEFFGQRPTSPSLATAAGYYLPWVNGEKGTVTTSPQVSGHIDQIDFDLWKHGSVGTWGDIAASKTGTIKFAKDWSTVSCEWAYRNNKWDWYYPETSVSCSWTEANLLVIEHSTNEYSYYLHIAPGSIPSELKAVGASVSAGRKIAVEGDTGWSTAPHLHFFVGDSYSVGASGMPWDSSPIQVEFTNGGETLHYSDFWKNRTLTAQHDSAPPCPDSGGVILYKDWHYDCGGEGEGRGYMRRDGTGWQNVGGEFDNRASSVHVPSGWSVKLFEHPDHGGGWACRSGDDDNFGGDHFNNGLSLNDNVSSFEVFHDDHCGQQPNRPPNSPSLHSPSDWHVARDGRAPTLCWHNPGDPDGDQLEFYAEVYESAVNANSGWISNTCWRPGQLDGHYHGYKWRVKARDIPHHAESGWSTTWHFTIESPNEPPSISFDTANGSSANRIESRERNWTFRGTASDPEGQLSEIEFRCSGDNCGSYYSRSGLGNWTYERHDMAGRNDVYFVAKDDKHSTASRHLDLRIDLAAPNTTISLNNEANPARWPAWFTGPVQVRLKAEDGHTGRARSGVKEIHYRLDSGAWQTRSGSSTSFTVSDDGTHTVEYYAVDNVGNQESTRSATFKIDQTPPSPPGGVSETHGVVSNQWQKAHNTPTFTWAASSDATSGVWGYQFYFGTDPNGVAYQTFLASDPREWTPQPGGVRTDTYYLRGRTRDNADNWSDWTDLFTFRYDGTPPENPGEATHAEGIINDTWQRTTNLADFDWDKPHDEGSGIKGYYVYWGSSETGESDNFIAAPAHSGLHLQRRSDSDHPNPGHSAHHRQ